MQQRNRYFLHEKYATPDSYDGLKSERGLERLTHAAAGCDRTIALDTTECALPRAKLLFTRRSPLDSCFAVYRTLFALRPVARHGHVV